MEQTIRLKVWKLQDNEHLNRSEKKRNILREKIGGCKLAQRKLGLRIKLTCFPGGSDIKNLPALQEIWVQSLGWEDPLEESKATHSSVLAWWIPNTEKSGRLQSIGSQRVGQNCSNLACLIWNLIVVQLCPTVFDPMNHSTPGLPVHHQLPEFTQTHAHRVSDAIQPSHPLSSPSPLAPNPSQHQSLFQWVNSSHEVTQVLEFQL